jgi:hypothetical protein
MEQQLDLRWALSGRLGAQLPNPLLTFKKRMITFFKWYTYFFHLLLGLGVIHLLVSGGF